MKFNIKSILTAGLSLVLLSGGLMPTFSAAGLGTMTNSGGGTYTNTDSTGNISGQIENAQAGSVLQGTTNLEYSIDKVMALVLFDDPDTGSAPAYPASSTIFGTGTPAPVSFIAPSNFRYDGNVARDILTDTDASAGVANDFTISGAMYAYPKVDGTVTISVTGTSTVYIPITNGGQIALIHSSGADSGEILVGLHGWVAPDPDTLSTRNEILKMGIINMLYLELTEGDFDANGYSAIRIFGDVDQSTVDNADTPGVYTGTVNIELTAL